MTTTSKPMIRIHDLSDDSIVDREMNDTEYADWQARQAAEATRQAKAAADAAARAAILVKLGITADEAQLLLGGN